MRVRASNYFDRLQSVDESELEQLREHVEREGYSAFRQLLDQFMRALKQIENEESIGRVKLQVEKASSLFPEPARFSPSWQNVWNELLDSLRWMEHVYEHVAVSDRNGEWQVLLDNPFTNQEVVCYPGLQFQEAAYLFGYFKPTLVRNEYLRLQKITTAIIVTGE